MTINEGLQLAGYALIPPLVILFWDEIWKVILFMGEFLFLILLLLIGILAVFIALVIVGYNKSLRPILERIMRVVRYYKFKLRKA